MTTTTTTTLKNSFLANINHKVPPLRVSPGSWGPECAAGINFALVVDGGGSGGGWVCPRVRAGNVNNNNNTFSAYKHANLHTSDKKPQKQNYEPSRVEPSRTRAEKARFSPSSRAHEYAKYVACLVMLMWEIVIFLLLLLWCSKLLCCFLTSLFCKFLYTKIRVKSAWMANFDWQWDGEWWWTVWIGICAVDIMK